MYPTTKTKKAHHVSSLLHCKVRKLTINIDTAPLSPQLVTNVDGEDICYDLVKGVVNVEGESEEDENEEYKYEVDEDEEENEEDEDIGDEEEQESDYERDQHDEDKKEKEMEDVDMDTPSRPHNPKRTCCCNGINTIRLAPLASNNTSKLMFLLSVTTIH